MNSQVSPTSSAPGTDRLRRTLLPELAQPASHTAVSFRRLLIVIAVYWMYVTVSDILYANSLRVGFSQMTSARLFVPWDARLVQHLILFPVLIGCLWSSVRIGWRPLWRAIPLQLLLAVFFAVAGAPALWIGQDLLATHPEMYAHSASQKDMPSSGELPLRIASATSFLLHLWLCPGGYQRLFAVPALPGFGTAGTALERAWNAARLAALRMQLSPHTLFNLLHTIRGQIAWDPEAAQTMVIQLGDLLRRLLTAGETEFTPLAAEIEFAQPVPGAAAAALCGPADLVAAGAAAAAPAPGCPA